MLSGEFTYSLTTTVNAYGTRSACSNPYNSISELSNIESPSSSVYVSAISEDGSMLNRVKIVFLTAFQVHKLTYLDEF